MSRGEGRALRLPLLKALKDLAKSGVTLDASVVTTYAFNGLFYEEVLLRAFERAGSRLNIVLVDAGQLAESMGDPLRRPSRAGVDYLLVPVPHSGAFHPKIVALLSERQPILALGSHNVTDAGYSHNEELTAFWGANATPPPGILRSAVEYALHWLQVAGGAPDGLLTEITGRVRSLLPPTPAAVNDEASLIVSLAETRLWEQLTAKVVGTVRRVTVVGPYFDADMSLFSAIEAALAPEEIIIGIQPATAVLPRPELAPKAARFVDAANLDAYWPKADEVGFSHGKALAIESAGGVVVSLGSANPTGAAWLRQTRWNAEANLCLIGERAAAAFSALGLDRLAGAAALQGADLVAIAGRSQALRSQEQATKDTSGPPVVLGRAAENGVFLPDFTLPASDHLEWADASGACRPVSLGAIEGGSLITLGDPRPAGGLYQLRSRRATAAFVLLNDAQALRTAALPRDSARILDHLGALDSGAGFTELLDLLDKHVLGPADGSGPGASRTTHAAAQSGNAEDGDVPFGPRGVSLPPEGEHGLRRPRLSDGLIADIISALIRALGAPTPAPTTDGDAPDLDEGDAADGPSSDDLARNVDADVDLPEIDWPRLVTACRKRLTVMLRRLEARLQEAASGDQEPGWALGRLVVVLSLLHRLRGHPPQSRNAINGRIRPASLVSLEQLRVAFGLAVRTLYGPGKLAIRLESAVDTRAAEERRLVDNLLLWFAREIGADYQREPREPTRPDTLQARADIGLVAMSAASYETLEPWAILRDPWLAVWDDAAAVPDDWTDRQIAYGSLLQRLRGLPRAPSARPPVAGDLVQWAGERDLPWVVAAVSGHKVSLTEPAGVQGAEKKVLLASVTLLDTSELLAARAEAVA